MPPFNLHRKNKPGFGMIRIIIVVLALIPVALIIGAFHQGTELFDEQDPILTASQQAAVEKLKAQRVSEVDLSAAAMSAAGTPLVGSAWDHALVKALDKVKPVAEIAPAPSNAFDEQKMTEEKRRLEDLMDAVGAKESNAARTSESEHAATKSVKAALKLRAQETAALSISPVGITPSKHRLPPKKDFRSLHGLPYGSPPRFSNGFSTSAQKNGPHVTDDDGKKDSPESDKSEPEPDHWEKKHQFIGSEPTTGDWLLDCPPIPPPGYPRAWPIMDLINNWSPDNPSIPATHHHGLCRLDYRKDLAKAMAYRAAEVPFVLYNVPAAEKVVKNWAQPGYLEKLLGDEQYRTEVSHNNHFMYFSGGQGAGSSGKKAWRPPTGMEQISFKDFKSKALECERRNCTTDEQHFYFRVTAPRKDHFIFKGKA
jgi:hypothetical protein